MAITSKPGRAWVPGAVACLALLGSVTGALGAEASAASRSSPAAAPDRRAAIPAPGQESVLYAVSCTSSASCWAVGRYRNLNGALVDQALHWNGRAWSLVTTPGAGSTKGFSALFAVTCNMPASCWAVGIRSIGRSEHDQVLHWNGRRWSLVSAPDPATATGGGSGLTGVRCTSPASCWAVGVSMKSGTAPSLNLILHWNGRRWSLVSVPNPGGAATGDISELSGVRCTSSASCWAVGDYGTSILIGGTDLNQALRWNGRKWSLVATPDPGGTGSGDFSQLSSVSCPSPGSCWAVGAYGSHGILSTSLNQALHWNGRKWSLVATPDPDGTGPGANNLLIDLACTSSASCWGVGAYGITRGQGVQLNQALHWDGRRWSLVATPDPGGTASRDTNFLSGVRCTSAASCWAVGASQPVGGAAVNQALHWNGTRWSAG